MLLPPDPARDALVTTADRYFLGLIAATGILFVGAIGEEFKPFGKIPSHRVNTRTKVRTRRKWVWWASKTYHWATVLMVVLGIGFEGWFEYLSASSETAIRKYDEGLLETAESNSADADGKVEALKKDNLALQGQVASLQIAAAAAETAQEGVETNLAKEQARTAKAEAETLRLREEIQPRQYTEAQEDLIVATLKPYAGSAVSICSTAYDVEGAVFGEYLANLLRQRLGMLVGLSGFGSTYVQDPQLMMGVEVFAPENEKSFQKALVSALNVPPVSVVAGPELPHLVAVIIQIGAKPPIRAKLPNVGWHP